MLPLCTLGAGEGSLAVRFLKLCHALRLEAGTFRLTSLLLKAIRTFHTDAGTEAGLASVQPFPLAGILPWFRDVEAVDGKGPSETTKTKKNDAILVEEDFLDPEPKQPKVEIQKADVSAKADVSGSIWVDGPLHQLSNSTKELKHVLKYYAWAVEGLKLVCSILSLLATKERVLEYCFYPFGRMGHVMGKPIKEFHLFVDSDRWGTVSLAFLKILSLRSSLLWGFKFESMFPGFEPTPENLSDNNKTSTKMYKAAMFISNNFWWAVLVTYRRINQVLVSVEGWVEGCSCHWELLQPKYNDDGSRQELPWPRALLKAWSNCPLRGLRCQDVSAGDLHEYTVQCFEVCSVKLAIDLQSEKIITTQVTELIFEFNHSQTHIVFSMCMKIAHWQHPPWGQYALAHRSPQKRRRAFHMLTTYLASNRVRHPQVAKWNEGMLCSELYHWAAELDFCFEILPGDSMPTEMPTDHATLKLELVLMRVTPYGERWVEGPHAATKRAISHAHNHSVVYVNSTHRWPELEGEISADTSTFKLLCSHVDRVASPVSALELVGLSHHAGLQRDSNLGKPSRERVFYNSDSWTMYVHKPPRLKTSAKGMASVGSTNSARQGTGTLEKMTASDLISTLKSDKTCTVNWMYSMPVVPASLARVEGLLCGHRRHVVLPGSEATDLLMDLRTNTFVDGLSQRIQEADASFSELLFFKLVAGNLHHAHVASASDATPITAETIAVSPHRVLSTERVAEREVLVEVTPLRFNSVHGLNSTMAFSASSMPFAHLERIQKWKRLGDHIEFKWSEGSDAPAGFNTNLVAVVATNIVNHSKPCLEDDPLSQELHDTFGHMKQTGWISDQNRLTDELRHRLRVGMWYGTPEFALVRAEDGELLVTLAELKPLTKMQLFLELQRDGWQHHVLKRFEKTALAPPYVKSKGNMIVWERASAPGFSHSYLLALLYVSRAPVVALEETPVPHFKVENEYLKIIGEQLKPDRKNSSKEKLDLRLVGTREDDWVDDVIDAGEGVAQMDVAAEEIASDGDLAEADAEVDIDGNGSGTSGSGSSSSSSTEQAAGEGDCPGDKGGDDDGDGDAGAEAPKHKVRAFGKFGKFCGFTRNGVEGYQMNCCHNSHNLRGSPLCTKSIQGSKVGDDPLLGLRLLKLWILHSVDKDTFELVAGKPEHRKQWTEIWKKYKHALDTVPTDAELDTEMHRRSLS